MSYDDDNGSLNKSARTSSVSSRHPQVKRLRTDTIMKAQFSKQIYTRLQTIGKEADKHKVNAYLVGGIVRDLYLRRKSEDIDIVVEGDAIVFAQQLQQSYGGKIKEYPQFGTATWICTDGDKVDLTSARTEDYESPAALPTVKKSNLKADLARRDFSINALAIQLNEDNFGAVIDFFNGFEDLQAKKVRILHDLSFVEDPTRIFRAVRFEQRFTFFMDQQTVQLAKKSVDMIMYLSMKRLTRELKKLFEEANPLHVIKRLAQIGVWRPLTNDQTINTSISENLYTSLMSPANRQECLNKESRLWFCYLISVFYNQSNWFENVSRFALTQGETKVLSDIHALNDDCNQIKVATSVGELHYYLKHTSMAAIIFYTATPKGQASKALLYTYVQKRHDLPQLINGDDLKRLGIPPGPIYSQLLLEIEVHTLNKKLTTSQEAISWIQARFP